MRTAARFSASHHLWTSAWRSFALGLGAASLCVVRCGTSWRRSGPAGEANEQCLTVNLNAGSGTLPARSENASVPPVQYDRLRIVGQAGKSLTADEPAVSDEAGDCCSPWSKTGSSSNGQHSSGRNRPPASIHNGAGRHRRPHGRLSRHSHRIGACCRRVFSLAAFASRATGPQQAPIRSRRRTRPHFPVHSRACFWIAALLLAFITVPDVSKFNVLGPLRSIAKSLKTIADRSDAPQAIAFPQPAALNEAAAASEKSAAKGS